VTTLKQAVQQVLEALEMAAELQEDQRIDFKKYGLKQDEDIGVKYEEAITAVKAALAQEEQEPVVVRAEALDLILEAAEVLDKVRVSCDAWEKYGLRDFLPDELTGTAGMLRDGSALTHPPCREWQGLTNPDIAQIFRDVYGGVRFGPSEKEFAIAVEAKLKEKNNR
jgi:hypothetical protein